MARVVALLLLVWEPLRFASEALGVLATIPYRGLLAIIELLAHGVVAALAAAAGLALWNGAPDARRLASLAILASVARVIQSLYWSRLPSSTMPGDEPRIIGTVLVVSSLALLALWARRPKRTQDP